jgi:ATP-binding cassette subfamily B protein
VVATALLTFLTVGINLGVPFLIRFAVDGLTDGTITGQRLTLLLAGYASAAVAGAFVSRRMRRIPLRVGHLVEARIRADLFEHFTRLEQAFYRSQRTGDLMTRMTSDLNMVAMALGQGLLQGFRTLIVFVMAFTVMFFTSWQLALIMLVLFPCMTLTFFWFVQLIRRKHEAVQEKYADVSNFSQETFTGVRTVKSFALEGRREGVFQDLNGELVHRHLGLSRVQQTIWPMFAFWFSLGMVLLLVVGGRLVIAEKLSLGALVQFNHYLLYMQWPMLALGWSANLVQRGRTSWGRIEKVFDRQPTICDTERTDSTLEQLSGDIEFRNVTVEIDGRRILDDVSLTIPAGSTLGLTGPTGSGKTVLVSLLTRVTDPTAGQILVGGRDIRDYPLEILRSRIGFAPQEPDLFSDTLANNIGFGLKQKSMDAILWASDIAHLHGDVETFPDEYETVLGERGVTLSGGQRQRTSIGRALARKPDILIFDDALAAVDTHTEAAIIDKLRPVARDRTTLVVSHRMSALRFADRIAVIEEGKITAQGAPAEVEQDSRYFRRLIDLQRLEAGLEEGS